MKKYLAILIDGVKRNWFELDPCRAQEYQDIEDQITALRNKQSALVTQSLDAIRETSK